MLNERKSFLSGMHPFTQILFLGLVTFVSLILIVIISGGITLLYSDSMADAASFDNTAVLKVLQMLQTIAIFIVPAVIFTWIKYEKVSEGLYLNNGLSTKTVILIILLMVFLIPMINVIGEWNANMKLPSFLAGLEARMLQMEELAKSLTEKFLNVKTIGGLLFNLLVLALLPALGEELFFRSTLQPIFIKWVKNKHVGIWVTAFIFSFIHLQFYGFIPRFLLGAGFGYLLFWTSSAWSSVIAHFINNAVAVIMYFLFFTEITDIDVDHLGADSSVVLLFIPCVIGTVIVMYYIRITTAKYSVRRDIKSHIHNRFNF